jgi:UDP-N-acetylmuramoyl-tripeptide--D-alanyl-D-alanine ligase
MNLDGKTIAEATGGKLVRDGEAGRILTDTRQLDRGSWFLALSGDRFDGHDFLDAAQKAGALGCIVSERVEEVNRGAVVVEDTTRAFQDLGRHARRQLEVPVVALTGSSGKTTTRALAALAMSGLGPVHQTVGNLNNHLGVPMTLLATPEDAAALVVEMGTSSHGEIALLADIARPHVRLFLNVGPAHLLELGGLEGVAREKGQLFATMNVDDVAVVNLDDPWVASRPVPGRRVTFGRGGDIGVMEAVVEPATLHTRIVFATPSGRIRCVLPAPGDHMAHNAAAALAVAHALDLDLHQAAAAMEAYTPVGMRMRRETLPGGVIALNDAYNANPQSMEASLKVLAACPGRRIAVLGDMLELGADEAHWHAEIGGLAVALDLDLVVLVGALMGRASVAEAVCYAEPEDAVEPLRAYLRAGDHVLVKGSRGARMERILHALHDEPSPGDP